jgi:hypothetical protein
MSRKKKISNGDPRRKFNKYKSPEHRVVAELRGKRHAMRELKLEAASIIQFGENDKRLLEPKVHTAWKPETKESNQGLLDKCTVMIEQAEATLLVIEKYTLLNRHIAQTLDGHRDSRLEELDELLDLVLQSQGVLRNVVRNYVGQDNENLIATSI